MDKEKNRNQVHFTVCIKNSHLIHYINGKWGEGSLIFLVEENILNSTDFFLIKFPVFGDRKVIFAFGKGFGELKALQFEWVIARLFSVEILAKSEVNKDGHLFLNIKHDILIMGVAVVNACLLKLGELFIQIRAKPLASVTLSIVIISRFLPSGSLQSKASRIIGATPNRAASC